MHSSDGHPLQAERRELSAAAAAILFFLLLLTMALLGRHRGASTQRLWPLCFDSPTHLDPEKNST